MVDIIPDSQQMYLKSALKQSKVGKSILENQNDFKDIMDIPDNMFKVKMDFNQLSDEPFIEFTGVTDREFKRDNSYQRN